MATSPLCPQVIHPFSLLILPIMDKLIMTPDDAMLAITFLATDRDTVHPQHSPYLGVSSSSQVDVSSSALADPVPFSHNDIVVPRPPRIHIHPHNLCRITCFSRLLVPLINTLLLIDRICGDYHDTPTQRGRHTT